MDKNMRFRFRAWNEFTKQFTYFNTPILWCAERIEDCGILFPVSNSKIFIAGYESGLEQCTGLKDKNGKLIYEGDIVEFYSYSVISALTGESMKRRVGIVIWNDEMLKFDITVNGEAIPDLCKKTDDNQFVIIGNIHDNKDLLEAK